MDILKFLRKIFYRYADQHIKENLLVCECGKEKCDCTGCDCTECTCGAK